MKKGLKVLLIIVIVVAVGIAALMFVSYQQNKETYVTFTGKTWFNYGIGQYIPTMKLRSGEAPKAKEKSVINNSDSEMFFQIVNAKHQDDFEDYVALLTSEGFVNDANHERREFSAVDSEGRRVKVQDWTEGTISVEASIEKKK